MFLHDSTNDWDVFIFIILLKQLQKLIYDFLFRLDTAQLTLSYIFN